MFSDANRQSIFRLSNFVFRIHGVTSLRVLTDKRKRTEQLLRTCKFQSRSCEAVSGCLDRFRRQFPVAQPYDKRNCCEQRTMCVFLRCVIYHRMCSLCSVPLDRINECSIAALVQSNAPLPNLRKPIEGATLVCSYL